MLIIVVSCVGSLTLICAGNGIGAAGAQALAEMLRVNGSITTLDLGGMPPLNCCLCWLTDFNSAGNRIGVVGAQALAEMLKVNGSISSLDLRSMHFS